MTYISPAHFNHTESLLLVTLHSVLFSTHVATIEYKKDTSINGSLNKNNIARYILAVPTESGITVKVCVGNGRVIVNGTISDDENDPIHSFNFVLVCNNCEGNQKCKNATAPPNSPPTSKRKRSSSNEEATVYISVTGLEQENTFIMSSTEGHVREFPAHTDASDACKSILIIMCVHGV